MNLDAHWLGVELALGYLLLAAGAIGGVGYLLGRMHAALLGRQEERERAVAALSGAPSWELKAQALEDAADEAELNGFPYRASNLRDAADRRRKLGQRL